MNYLLVPAWVFHALQYAAVPLALAAGALLAIGFFSARRGWEPRCRRCAHDLRSADPTKGACPECGADLARIGAVQAGRRRTRPIVAGAGFALLGLTALTAWKLDAAGARMLRGSLVASMPTQTLVDALFEGGDQQPLILSALQQRVGANGATRVLPSGELLDAILRAADRCEEPGRRPLSVVLQSDVRNLLGRLDQAETNALVDRAVQELVESDGTKMSRYLVALALESQGRDDAGLWEKITDKLNATPEGRRVTALRPTTDGQVVAGAVEQITLKPPLPTKNPRFTMGVKDENALTFVFGEATLESIDGAPRRSLALVPKPRVGISNRDDPSCELLIDAPPGAYRLKLTGVMARSVLLPRVASVFDAPPPVSVEDAMKLEGSLAFDGSCEMTVVAQSPPVRRFSNEDHLVERAAKSLASCRISRQNGSASIDIDALLGTRQIRSNVKEEPAPAMALQFSARQGGKTWRLGELTASGGGYSSGIGSLPREIVLSEPFELIAEPLTAANAGSSGATMRRTSGRRGGTGASVETTYVWATYALKFADATKAPEVVITPMPLVTTTATARSDDATRKLVEGWASALGNGAGQFSSMLRRGGREPIARTIDLNSGAKYRSSGEGEEAVLDLAFAWDKGLYFSGWFELWSGDRLAMSVEPYFGSPAGGTAPPSLTPVFPVANDSVLIVRYRPDERVGIADASGPFAYVSAPFELRFASSASAAELVWLDRAPTSVPEEGKTP